MCQNCLQLNWGPTLTLGETEKIWEGQEGKSNHGTASWWLGCSLCSAFLKILESIKQRLGSYFGWDWQNLRRQRLWRQSWHCKLATGLLTVSLLTMIQQMCHKLTIKTYVEVQRIQEQSWHCKLVTGLMCSAFPADFLDSVPAGTSNGKYTLSQRAKSGGKSSQKVIKEINRKNWLTKNDWNSKWAIWQGHIWHIFWKIEFG